MKIMVLLLSCCLFSGCASFSDTDHQEYLWQTLNAIDAAQTVQIARNPHCRSEGDPLTSAWIGSQPSERNVYAWWVGSSILHYFGFKWIDKKFGKNKINIGIRSVENAVRINTIVHNHKNGLRVNGLSRSETEYCQMMKQQEIKRNSINFEIITW